MLQDIRDRLSGPVVWAFVGLISIPFAFVGIESFNTGGGDPTVVKVGSEKITASQLQRAYENRLRQYQEMLGENFRMDMINPEQVRSGVLDELIQQSVLREHADDYGYTASSASLLKSIEAIPAFQKEGRFDKDSYNQVLRMQGYTPASFERQLRDGLAQDQVREAVLESAFITPKEAAANWRLSQQERGFSSVSFSLADTAAGITVSDEEVAKYYKDNAGKYKALERLKVAYVELSLAAMPEAPAPAASVLKPLYDAEIASYSAPEERRASHILVSIGADAAAARKKAQELKARIDAGTDFATVAKEASDDPGSKDSGGDLGMVRKGQMTPKFEDALFAMKAAGAVSEPVETEFGFHLIKLMEIKPAAVKPFEDPDVQAQLLAAYRKKDAELRFRDQSEKLEQLAFENLNSLEPVAKALGLTVQTTDWFVRGQGAGLTGNAEFQKAAFASEVIKADENSKPVSVGENRLVVLRKAEYQPERPLKLEEVRDGVRSELKSIQAKAKAQALADDLVKRLKAPGADFASVTAAQNLTATTQAALKRDAKEADAAVLKAVFALPKPAANGMSYGTAVSSSGDVVVIALQSVTEPAVNPADETAAREAARVKDALAGLEFAGFKAAIEKAIGVGEKTLPALSAVDPASP